jgi:haloalkane dehalogenase
MWREVMPALAGAGWRALAPDLAGFGDSPVDPPGTWERQVAALERFAVEQELGPVALCVHDWGALIGLRWACDRGPGAVRGLFIAGGGFFPDGKWHGMAQVLRTPGDGEQLVEQLDGRAFADLLRSVSPGMDDGDLAEYAKVVATPEHRAAVLELYRSGNFEELEPYRGRLAGLGVPVSLLWGADDPFAPVATAHRLARELPGAEMQVLDGVGHFLFDDAPAETASAVVAWLGRLA